MPRTKRTETKELFVPFSRHTGEMLSYVYNVEPGQDTPNVVWKANHEFDDALRYKGYSGGRSAMSMRLVSAVDGREYSMFWRWFDALLRRPGLKDGPSFEGRWTYCKQGQNYSVRPVWTEPEAR